MKQIADTYDSFPKDMQSPATFGRPEDFSVLDLFAGGTALATGHPLVAGGIAGRLSARRALVSEPMQNRMFNRGAAPAGLSPNQALIGGELAQPKYDDPVARALRGY
jgi:hypothetical protein